MVKFIQLFIVVVICGSASSSASQAAPARYMIAAANPYAAQAGLDMLAQGGSAVDAAIAAQMVLNLVEPQSSGLGGGGFMLTYDAADGATWAYDGRETAPAAVTPALFLDGQGAPLKFYDAAIGGRGVGVPGLVAMLEMAHKTHGKLPWAILFEPAITLAEKGFSLSPRLHELIIGARDVGRYETARNYFFTAEGLPKPVGTTMINRDLAATLRAIAAHGAAAFYEGEIAADMVAAIGAPLDNPGLMTLADLAGYRAKRRDAVCGAYRQFRVCGMGPPSSGGVTTLQILGLLEGFDLASLAPGSVEAVHLISEASRLAYADRARYLADGDFHPVPVRGLLDRSYLAARSAAIDLDFSMGQAAPGDPPFDDSGLAADGPGNEGLSTSHLAVIDSAGNAVSFTSSIESAFGSRIMVRGFLLNNQLTDFSFRPEIGGVVVANRVEALKRPRSSMAPTLVFDADGRLKVSIGSPGGSRIIGYVVQSLVAILDWGLELRHAIALPHHVNRNGPIDLEEGTPLEALRPALEALGHEVRIRPLTSGLHGVSVTGPGLAGGADPRREGVVLGD